MSDLGLNPADIENLTRAVRVATKRGAFEMEEVTQLMNSVSKMEQWLEYVRAAQQEAQRQEEAKEKEDASNSEEAK